MANRGNAVNGGRRETIGSGGIRGQWCRATGENVVNGDNAGDRGPLGQQRMEAMAKAMVSADGEHGGVGQQGPR